MLQPMISRPVYLGAKHPSGTQDQIFISVTVAGLLMWGGLSDECMGLSFKISAGPRQPLPLSGPNPAGLMTIFYCLRLDTPPT
jgi:hypothetical protein